MQEAVCRACLSSEGELIQLDKPCIENLNVLTNLTVEKKDGLPQNICSDCKTQICHFITFRAKCIESNSFLHSVSLQLELVKEEPAEDEAACTDDDQEFTDDKDDIKLEVSLEETVYYKEPVENIEQITEETSSKRSKKRSKCSKSKHDISKSKVLKVKESEPNSKLDKNEFYECGLCANHQPTKAVLSDHIDEHLKSGSPCEICSEYFPEWQEMAAHRYKHIGAGHRVCHLCDRRFKRVGTQWNHYYKEHTDKGVKQPMKPRIPNSKREKKYICNYCNKGFVTKQKLRVHIAIHLPRDKLPCPECNKKFSCETSLKFHRKSMHSSEGEYCSSCQRRVPALAAHHCQRRAVCPVCGKRVATHFLQRHMVTHTSERPYKCDKCGNSYKWESSLESHTNKHLGLRPHRCPHCPMGFYTYNVMKKHIRIHTGERPYVCDICSKAFTASYNLKKHMTVHAQAPPPPPRRDAHGFYSDTSAKQ